MNAAALRIPLDRALRHIPWGNLGAGLAPVAAWLCAFGLAWSAAALVWEFVPPPERPAPPAQAAATGAPGAAQRDAVAVDVAALHLFGTAAAPVAPRDAPDTSLQLTLRGVFAARDRQLARALVAAPDGSEQVYAIGSALPGNATLREIHATRVLLERAGRFETLRLPEETSSGVIASTTAARAGALPSVADMTSLRQLRDAALSNPQTLGEFARIDPVEQGGRFVGYRIIPTGNRQLLRRHGLTTSDIITAVNGIALDSPVKGLEALQQLASAQAAQITLLRRGREQTITVRLDE